jgi:hypothetical protein
MPPFYRRKIFANPSLEQIEEAARLFAKKIHFGAVLPIFQYEELINNISNLFPGIDIEIVPDTLLAPAEARVDGQNRKLQIASTLNKRGISGEPHPLMTLVHELCHIYLAHIFPSSTSGISRSKIPGLKLMGKRNLRERNDEWVANRVAGAVLMPFNPNRGPPKNINDLLDRHFVTPRAASERLPQLQHLHRNISGLERALPKGAVVFLSKQKRMGFKVSYTDDDFRRWAISRGYTGNPCEDCGSYIVRLNQVSIECEECGYLCHQ